MSGIDVYRVRLPFTQKPSILPELRTPLSLSCAPNYLSPPINYIAKYYEGERSFRDCQTRRWRESMWRGDRGFTDPACPRGRKSERGRNTPIAFHGPLRGSHVHRGGSGDVGVASSAYVTCAPCARCDATRRRRRRHRVLVDAIANGTDTLIERCVSTRKESNPRGLGLYEQTYSARKLLDKFRIIKFVHKMLLLNSALSCSPP